MGKPPKFDAIPNKYVFFTGGIEPGLTSRPGGENWPLVFPELLGRLNADPINVLITFKPNFHSIYI